MTAHELAAELLAGANLDVVFTYDCGDYWHTIVAANVNVISEGDITHSAYHDMDKVVDSRIDDEDEDRSETMYDKVIMLSR